MNIRNFCAGLSYTALASMACISLAQAPASPYKILKIAKVGGLGSFDYLNADSAGRKLYIPRAGPENPRIFGIQSRYFCSNHGNTFLQRS
jgi:hypothetical protein